MWIVRVGLFVVLACAAVGCGNVNASRAEQLDGQAIMPGRGRLPTEPYSPVDQPGSLAYDDARSPRDPDAPLRPSQRRPTSDVSRALDRAVPPLAESLDQAGPSTSRATTATRPADSPGAYMTIGGVVAEVNGVPIYADKVISDIELLLAARARELSETQFKQLAAKELNDQVRENIERELLFAAAERYLEQREKEQGRYVAEQWRQQQISQRGVGSIETARRWFAERGRNFEQQVEEEYRATLIRIMLQKRIIPHTQVTAAEMRQYYDRNREAEYTVRDAAQFEMIQIDPAKVGGREVAKRKIDDLHARAAGGEDFTELAKFSTGPALRNSAGELSWIERKAFAFAAVEEAVWKLQPGEVTPVIEDGGKFYIAKLDRKRPGRTMPFEEEATQAAIREKLWSAKFRPRYDAMLQDLKRESIVRTDEQMMASALEIAMQRYRHWAAAK